MKILEINKFFYPRRGAERHFLDLIALLEKRGHEVEVFAMRHPENLPSRFAKYFPAYVGYNASDSDFWQRLIGIGRLFWSFQARRNMERLLHEWRPDVAHIHNIYHQLSPSILGPLRKRDIPIVMTVHDYHLVSPDKDAYYPEVGRRYWKFLFAKKYGFAKRLLLVLKKYWEDAMGSYEKSISLYIVPSAFVKDVLVNAGLPGEKITVLPHFVADTGENVAAEEGNEKPFALHFGSLSEEKGVNDLVGMFETLETQLLLAGSREDGFVPRESGYASFVGWKSREELTRLMARAACVVGASRLPETFGLVALEAIACGKPFFGLKSGAYPGIIVNGKNGYLAENISELREELSEFFAGKYAFDPQEIRKDAYGRFGEERYGKTFEILIDREMKKE